MDNATQVREKLATLEANLNDQVPNLAVLLRDIHKQLKSDPEVVTLLSEEECSIFVRGLKKQTATEIATAAPKAKGKSVKNMTMEDL